LSADTRRIYPHRTVLTFNEASGNVLHFALHRVASRFAFFAVCAVDLHPHGVADICAERTLCGSDTNAVSSVVG
jgi:hypothetical protein